MVGGPAGDDHDPAQVAQLVVGEADVAELEVVAGGAVGDRLGDGVRLLVDLLQHEGLEAALLGRVLVPVHLLDLALDRSAVGVEQLRAIGANHDDLVVLEVLDRARLAEERGDRRGDEALAFADPDDERALEPRADEQTRLFGRHRDERVVAAELRVGLADGRDEVALEMVRNQVGDDLGVGLRA